MTSRSVRRRLGTSALVLTALGAVRAAWHPAASLCAGVSTQACLSAAVVVVAAAAGIAWALRVAWLATTAARAVGALLPAQAPLDLAAAGVRIGASVRCVSGQAPAAFCAGIVRPRVYVTTGLVNAVTPKELDAVLTHEAQHARRRDPARRAATQAAADVLFCLPLVAWWARQRVEQSELAADRAAIQQCGRGAVARALAVVAAPPLAQGVTGYDGAADARVAQLLGDPLPRRRPSLLIGAASVVGLVALVVLAMCVGQQAGFGIAT